MLLVSVVSCRYGVFAAERSLGEVESVGGTEFDFGLIYLTQSADQTLTLFNRRKGASTQIAMDFSNAPAFEYKDGAFPGTGGTCTQSLDADQTCTLVISYVPTESGTQSQIVPLSYFDGEETLSISFSFTGASEAEAALTFSEGATYDFGSVAVGSTSSATLTVSNAGEVAATSLILIAPALAAPFTYLGGTYPGTGGTCTSELAAKSSCTVVLRYAPVAVGASSSSINFTFETGANSSSLSISIMGTGVLASLTISDGATFSYGTQNVGTTTDKTFTVTNSGGFAASALGIGAPALGVPYYYKNGAYPGFGGDCGTTLGAGLSCTLIVTFGPTTPNTFNDTIRLSYNDGQATQTSTRAITGISVTVALLTISDGATYDFGTVAINSSNDKTFTLINSGSTSATSIAVGSPALAAPYSFKGGTYPGTGGTCGVTLTSGGSCTIIVNFSPSASGTANDTIRISYNDSAATQSATRAVTGVTTSTALLGFSASPLYTFTTTALGSSTEATFTLTNSGGGDATAMGVSAPAISDPFTYKGGSFPGTGGTCAGSLAAGLSCTMVVLFSPTSGATFNDTIRIGYNNGTSVQTATLPLTGTGSLASLAVSDGATYNFGSLATGATTTKAFTVSNSGGVTASAIGEGSPALAAPYSFPSGFPGSGGSCGLTLAASASCSIVAKFAPTVIGTTTDTIRVSYSDGQNTQSATRSVTGTGLTPAVLSVSDGPTYDFASHILTTTTTHTFTVSNSGTTTATSLAVVAGTVSAPFSYLGGTYPGTGATCGTTLAGSSSCTVIVEFAPTTAGAVSDQVSLSYHNGVSSGQTATRDLTAMGQAPGTLSISESPSFNFGPVYMNSTSDKTFTVTNTGDVDATIVAEGSPALAAPFSYVGGTFPGTGGNCGGTLTPAGACSLVIRFSPTATGSFNDTIRLTYNNGLASQTGTRTISGTGALATLSITAAPTLSLGDILVNTTSTFTLTVSNPGAGAASLLGPAAPAVADPFSYVGGGYPGTNGTCGNTLSAGSACTLKLQVTPTALGSFSGSITLTYFDGNATQTTSCNFTGVGVSALLSISDGPTFDFGSLFVSQTSDKTLTITNSGTGPATSVAEGAPALSAPILFKGGSYPGTGGTCGATIAGSSTCTVVVTFAPTAGLAYSKTLKIQYTDGTTSTSISLAITGTGVAVASLSISDGATYDFGSVYINNAALEKIFTVTNGGGSDATSVGAGSPSFLSSYTYKDGTFPGTGGSCGSSITAGSSCTVVVRFRPTVGGTFDSAVAVGYNDGVTTTNATRPITGIGVDPAVLTISDGATFSFGSLDLNTPSDKTFTVTNSGPITATAMGAGAPAFAAPFSFKGGSYPGTAGTCGATLAAAGTCTIVVRYKPTSAGTFNGTVSVAYTDGLNAQTATRDVTGTCPGFGLLDLAFEAGLGGRHSLSSLSEASAEAAAIAIQADGKIVVAGSGGGKLTVMRFSEEGERLGILQLDSGPARAMAIQKDGKILVVGQSGVFRFTQDLVYDLQYEKVSGDLQSLQLLPDGKIAVGGSRAGDFLLAVYREDGTLDRTPLTIDLGEEDSAHAIALDERGDILLGGESKGRAIWIRVFSNDQWESSAPLGEGTGIFSLGVQRGGRVVAVGGSVLSLWESDGELLAQSKLAGANIRALQVLANGQMAIAGGFENEFLLGLLNENLSFDSTFGNHGLTSWSDGPSEAFALTTDSRGRLLTAGRASAPSRFAIARFRP